MAPPSKRGKPFGIGTRKGGFDTVTEGDQSFNYGEKVYMENTQRAGRDYWTRCIGGVVNPKGPWYITIDPLPEEYLQMNRARLEVKMKVTKGNGDPLVGYQDFVAPINLLGVTMWKSVEVHLNDQPFTAAAAVDCGLKAYLDTLLSYDFDARHTHLHTQMMHPDTAGREQIFNLTNAQLKRALLANMLRYSEVPENMFTDEETETLEHRLDRRRPTAEVLDSESNEMRMLREAQIRDEDEEVDMILNKVICTVLGAPVEEVSNDLRNYGWEARAKMVADSDSFVLYSPIPHDFFNLNKVIGPGNKIDIKLERYPDEFLLNSYQGDQERFKLEVQDIKLHLHAVRRSESIPRPVVERYRMNETHLFRQVVAQGMPRTSFRIVHGGVLPKTVLVAMHSARASEGAYDVNPLAFTPYKLKRIALMVNGEELPSGGGLRTDFSYYTTDVARAYNWLYDNTGAWSPLRGNCVSLEAFKHGSFVIPFDLTPDRCNGLHDHLPQYGQIDLELDFKTSLPEPVAVLYELSYNRVVINDKSRGTLSIHDIEK